MPPSPEEVVRRRALRRTPSILAAVILLVHPTLVLCDEGPAGPDPRYPTYDQILERFRAWGEAHPDVFHSEVIGLTGTRSEPIWAARIGPVDAVPGAVPQLILFAAQHANECTGTLAALMMMEDLLCGYGADPGMTAMVDGLHTWFVPVVNVDGHRLVFGGHPDWALWRKTTRDLDGDGQLTFPKDGVDPNRNWDYRWEEHDAGADDLRMYKGDRPFSEPCVVAMRDIVLREMPVLVMDYHSPAGEFLSNTILWPWVDRKSLKPGPDGAHYWPITREMARRTLTAVDSVFYNGDWPSYDTLPKAQCWIYANTGICALLMEIGDRFWYEGPDVETMARRAADGSFYLLERVLAGPGLTGCVTDAATGLPLDAEMRVEEAHDWRIGPRVTQPGTGRYWRLLNPGAYTVSARVRGYGIVTRRVTVPETGWTQVDLELEAGRHSWGRM